MEMAHFKKYGLFKCLVRVNCVSPFIVIILIGSKNLERRLFSPRERNFALDSTYIRYKQSNTVYFIKFY